MAPKKQTYYTYSSGIPSKNLHLGNLTHNFRDPGSLEPFVFDGFVELVLSLPHFPYFIPEEFQYLRVFQPLRRGPRMGTSSKSRKLRHDARKGRRERRTI
jgi:hypothetical protein